MLAMHALDERIGRGEGMSFAGSKEEKTRSELRHNFSLDEEREAIRGADGGG